MIEELAKRETKKLNMNKGQNLEQIEQQHKSLKQPENVSKRCIAEGVAGLNQVSRDTCVNGR
ncbi:hypothetical protein EXN66_Car014985 [Channa argus]|uniref:Uncharacterized protein n=1 Tax=Channa argus TaxID=215402 RepID=A0A6G1QAJ7_CHAAH|nr:hypothetical protein EXN66_Car014985 [Channa argus]